MNATITCCPAHGDLVLLGTSGPHDPRYLQEDVAALLDRAVEDAEREASDGE